MLSVLIFYSSHFQLTVAPSGELDRWGRAGVLPLSRRVLLCLERSRPHWPERPGFVSSKRPKQSSAGEPRGIGWGLQNHGRWLVFVNPSVFLNGLFTNGLLNHIKPNWIMGVENSKPYSEMDSFAQLVTLVAAPCDIRVVRDRSGICLQRIPTEVAERLHCRRLECYQTLMSNKHIKSVTGDISWRQIYILCELSLSLSFYHSTG